MLRQLFSLDMWSNIRCYIARYDEGGLEALIDKRLTQASHRYTPVDEVMQLMERYQGRYSGWNAKHSRT